MRRIAILAVGAALWMPVAPSSAGAETRSGGWQVAQAMPAETTGARPAYRPRARVRIFPRPAAEDDVYPRYNPGPNAVRICNATYVQEYRPSGTVIVPRMSCYWRRG